MNPEFVAARNQILQKVEAHPEDPKLLSALGVIDSYLGRKQEALQEANRAVKMLRVSKDALDGPGLVDNMARVCAWTSEPDLALQQLAISVNTLGGISYGELKLDPVWDPIRTDPRFERLLAELAPKD